MRMNFFSAIFAAIAIFWSGVGQAAWTFFPIDKQASGLRVLASIKRTWPLRNERIACSWSLLKNSICGRRTGFLVAASQTALISPDRSMVTVGFAAAGFAASVVPS